MRKVSQFLSKNIEKDLLQFFIDNPNPDDKMVHQWAEKNNLDVHKVETEIYKLATISAQFLLGGRANEKRFSEKDADKKELEMGIKVEREHIDNIDIQKRIALDHLAESNKYYTALAKMEKSLEIED